jgi:hypothetical protein
MLFIIEEEPRWIETSSNTTAAPLASPRFSSTVEVVVAVAVKAVVKKSTAVFFLSIVVVGEGHRMLNACTSTIPKLQQHTDTMSKSSS